VVEIRLGGGSSVDQALGVLRPLATGEPRVEREAHRIVLPVGDGASVLSEVVRRIDGEGIVISELSLHRPSLDDVFLELTGRRATAADEADDAVTEEEQPGRRFGRGRKAA